MSIEIERAAARARAEIVMGMCFGMNKEPDVRADLLFVMLDIKQPFGLWAHRYITKLGHVGTDYTRFFENGKSRFLLSRDFAFLTAGRAPSMVGGVIACHIAKTMCRVVELPGNEHLRSMEGMMAEAERHHQESERLRAMFETERLGRILGEFGDDA